MVVDAGILRMRFGAVGLAVKPEHGAGCLGYGRDLIPCLVLLPSFVMHRMKSYVNPSHLQY